MSRLVLFLLPILVCFWLTKASPTATQSVLVLMSASDDKVVDEEPLYKDEEQPVSTTTKSTATNADSSNYLNRLDFISVIVICAIVAFCFAICVVIGCRRKKRHPSHLDFTDSQPQSITESRSEPRTTNLAYSPSDLRAPESPPPTYSIIERQTSFTSYISQSSSHYEIPPDYDEALSIGDSTNGEPYSCRPSRPGSRTGSERSVGRFFPTRDGSVIARPTRSESARVRGLPRSRSYRSSSDVGRKRRPRLSSRPATVSEDDSSQCSLTTSGMTDASVAPDAASHTINVVAEVSSTAEARVTNSEHPADGEGAQPLLSPVDLHIEDCREDDTMSVECSQKKESSSKRKLTLV